LLNIVFKNIVLNNEVNFNKSSSVYIEISGHSGLNKKGTDILCSAVSVLFQTFILTVDRILKIKQHVKRSDGFLSSLINLNSISAESESGLKLLIESLLIGLLEINGEYPDRIKIEFVND